jgi:hypothetical protein
MDFSRKYDVVVAGAGIAGCAAALAAARRGCSVALIEKQTLIGGLATSGLIFVYLPLCDGYGHQVTFGLAEELLKRSLKYSPYDLPPDWGGSGMRNYARGNRYECYFSPAGFILSLDEALSEAGVDLWLETAVCQVNSDADGKVVSVEVENISGHGLIAAGCFVDASGSAHIVRRAGGTVSTAENTPSVWFIQNSPDENRFYNIQDTVHIKTLHEKENRLMPGDSLRGKCVTAFTRRCWSHIREYYDQSYASGKNRFRHFPIQLPGMNEFRKIASADGMEKLADTDFGRFRESSIGLAGDWRRPGPVWETPFGALVPEKTGGVFTAGRCIGATGLAWEIFRVIPACAMTGEAAGIAAALCVSSGVDTRELKASAVQNELRKNKIPLHLDEIPGAGNSPDARPMDINEGIAGEDAGFKSGEK